MINIRRLAKESLTSSFGLNEDLFDVLWDTVSANYESLSTGKTPSTDFTQLGSPLAIAGLEDSEAVRAIIIFVGADKQAGLISSIDELVAVLQSLGKKHAAQIPIRAILDGLKEAIAQEVVEETDPSAVPAEYIVLLSHPSGDGVIQREASERQVQEEYQNEKLRRDLFVYHRNIYKRATAKPKDTSPERIDLDENVFRLLMIFLKYKDRQLPALTLYNYAWSIPPGKRETVMDAMLMVNLKQAVRQLRRAFEDISEFEIPRAHGRAPFENLYYLLRGAFSFCVICTNSENEKYNIPEMELPQAIVSTH